MSQKKNKSSTKQFVDQNPVEAIRNVGKGVVQTLSKDMAQKGMSDLWKQLIGTQEYAPTAKQKLSGDLSEGEEVNLGKVKEEKREKAKFFDLEPGIDYRREILHGDRKIANDNTRNLEVKIHEILIELKRIASSSKEISVQFKEIAVEQRIVNPGKYHESFFSWVLTVIRSARIKIEDSASWLTMFKSKKAQKKYWNQFKKHGTTFGLSNERVVATQTG